LFLTGYEKTVIRAGVRIQFPVRGRNQFPPMNWKRQSPPMLGHQVSRREALN